MTKSNLKPRVYLVYISSLIAHWRKLRQELKQGQENLEAGADVGVLLNWLAQPAFLDTWANPEKMGLLLTG